MGNFLAVFITILLFLLWCLPAFMMWVSIGVAKRAKYQQVKTQKDDFENKIYNQNAKLKKSFFDSSVDSVKVYMDLQVLEKELAACEIIMTGLFPNGLNAATKATA